MISHNVKQGTLGNSIIVYDTTTLDEYSDLGIDINNDIVSITFRITINGVEYSKDITTELSSLRDGNGLVIDSLELTGISSIGDGVHDTVLEIVENSTGSDVTHTSEKIVVFYELIKYKILSKLKDTDWKEFFGCYTDRLRTPLRYYNWLLNLEYTSELGLYDDAEQILTSLQEICQ